MSTNGPPVKRKLYRIIELGRVSSFLENRNRINAGRCIAGRHGS